jgi:hypothetical protein
VAIFDYQFMVGRHRGYSGFSIGEDEAGFSSSSDDDDTQYFFQTVIVFHDETIDAPRFKTRPENFMDLMANILRFEDINFPDFPVFSKHYRLHAHRVDEVRALFQPNLLKFYEGHKLCTEANGSSVIIYPFGFGKCNGLKRVRVEDGQANKESSSIAPNEVKAYLNIGMRLLSLLERNLADRLQR